MNLKHLLGAFFSCASIPIRLLIDKVKLYNFHPVGGLGVVEGAKQPLWLACVYSLIAMAGSDLALGMVRGFPANHFLMVQFVYPSMLVYVFLGWLLAKKGSWWRLGLASVLGSIQFYLVTNFGPWVLYTDRYAPDWSGLLHSYVAGLEFLGRTIVGDLTFTAIFAAAHALAEKPAEQAEANSANAA